MPAEWLVLWWSMLRKNAREMTCFSSSMPVEWLVLLVPSVLLACRWSDLYFGAKSVREDCPWNELFSVPECPST